MAEANGGNAVAGAVTGAGTEWLGTKVAAYLEGTNLSSNEKKAIQNFIAVGSGLAVGAVVGGDSLNAVVNAENALTAERFNRQLHENELKRIKELAQGDEELQARLEIAACALVKCSAQLSEDNPEYTTAKTMEILGNSVEFAQERELLSKQVEHWQDVGILKPLFSYNVVYEGLDKASALDDKYAVMTRIGGGAQAIGGATLTVGSYTVTAATCVGSAGGVCVPAAGIGTVVSAYGVDQLNAGVKTVIDGNTHSTYGADLLSKVTGLSPETAELVYSVPSMAVGVKSFNLGMGAAGKLVANEVTAFSNASKYVVKELGKDVKAVTDYAGAAALKIPNNKYVVGVTENIGKGIESIENITFKQYFTGAATGFTASSAAQYLVNGNIDYNSSIKTGLMTPYLLYPPLATSFFLGSTDKLIESRLNNTSYIKGQNNYFMGSLGGELINNSIPSNSALKSFSPFMETMLGEVTEQYNKNQDKK